MQTLGTYAASSTATIVAIEAPSFVIWRRRLLPRWLAVLGAAEIITNIFELAGLCSRQGALAGGYTDGIGPIIWVLWVAAASVCMALRFYRDPVE